MYQKRVSFSNKLEVREFDRTEDDECTWYQVLNLESDATEEDIKKQYRKRRIQTHPDINMGRSEDFKDVINAYSGLMRLAQKKLRKSSEKA